MLNFTKDVWDNFYNNTKSSDIKWETGAPDHTLIDYLKSNSPPTALDIGCGIGTNAVFMAQQGIRVTAFDIAHKAIKIAKAQAKYRNVLVDFYELDMLAGDIPNAPFDFIYDRGCFHLFTDDAMRSYLEKIALVLAPGGTWLCLGPDTMVINAIKGKFEVNVAPTYLQTLNNSQMPAIKIIATLKRPYEQGL